MSKSLEVLEELSLMINREKHINSEWNKKINDLKQTIKQDLEYLEQLDKENLDLMSEIQEVHKENLTIKEIKKENQELIVNKNVAQAVALNQKREIAELKDQIYYLKEDGEEWQSAYEWSQAQNSILKLENQELKDAYINVNEELHCAFARGIDSARFDVLEENEKLKKVIEILSNYICVRNPLDEEDTYYLSALFSNEEIDKQTHDLLKEVLESDRT